jgi:hypothetical protein
MPIADVKEFGQYIENNTASDIGELPKCGSVGWFGPNGGFMFFEVFKPNPLDRFSTIVAIFQSDDTIRLYQLPTAPPKDVGTDWRVRPASRWTLTRVAPTYVSEAFPSMDSIADAIVEEFDEIGEGSTSADAELARVIQFLEDASPLTPVPELVEQLGDLQHREDDDDDEEPEEEPAGVGAAPVPVAPLTPVPLAPVPPSTTEPR